MTKTKEKKVYLFNNDIIFKNAFSTEKSLIALIYYGTGIKVNKVLRVDKELTVSSVIEKRETLDLLCLTDKGVVSIEINNNSNKAVYLRNFFYYCKILVMRLEKAKDYTKIEKHIQLNITWKTQKYFPFMNTTNMPYIDMHITEDSTKHIMFGDIFNIRTINMDFFRKMHYNENINEREKFFKFLSSKTEEELKKYAKGDKLMEDLEKKVKELNEDPNIVDKIAIKDENEILANTEHSLGVEEGMKKGLERGKMETAKNLLNMNMSQSDIAKATGLSLDVIKSL